MATRKSTSRLVILGVAAALAIAATPATADERGRRHSHHDGLVLLSPLPHLRRQLLPPLPLLAPQLRRPLLPPLRVEPWHQRTWTRTWNNYEFYGPRRHTRGDDRRFPGPQERRRQSQRGEHRGHSEQGNRWR